MNGPFVQFIVLASVLIQCLLAAPVYFESDVPDDSAVLVTPLDTKISPSTTTVSPHHIDNLGLLASIAFHPHSPVLTHVTDEHITSFTTSGSGFPLIPGFSSDAFNLQHHTSSPSPSTSTSSLSASHAPIATSTVTPSSTVAVTAAVDKLQIRIAEVAAKPVILTQGL